MTIGGLAEGVESFRKETGQKRFALIESIAVVPLQFDTFKWTIYPLHWRLPEMLSLAIARAQWSRRSVGANSMVLRCSMAWTERCREHTAEVQVDVEDLVKSWALMEWEMMGEVLGRPDSAILPHIYDQLLFCGKLLRHMGLLSKA